MVLDHALEISPGNWFNCMHVSPILSVGSQTKLNSLLLSAVSLNDDCESDSRLILYGLPSDANQPRAKRTTVYFDNVQCMFNIN